MGMFSFLTGGKKKELNQVPNQGWTNLIRDWYPGAWQQNKEIRAECVLAYHAVFGCISLIASDISKLKLRLMQEDSDGIGFEVKNAAHSPVLRRPNSYQTTIQFIESWLISKLSTGNTYVYLEKDASGLVREMHILDPKRVKVLVSDFGDVFYEIEKDNLAGVLVSEPIRVPADRIIHDRFNCLFHPLVGISPLYACGLAAQQGLKIQKHSYRFFQNNAQPGGILTAPGSISQETADRLKLYWETKFSGDEAGKIAVLGDNLTYQGMTTSAAESQLIEQLRWTAEVVCSCFHVPLWMLGLGERPAYNNVQTITLQYYSQCLQKLIEDLELCLDGGLGLIASGKYTEFDIKNLMRMDTKTQVETLSIGTGAGIIKPNEARKDLGYAPVDGGDTPYLQQQNFALSALAQRDANDPFAKEVAQPEPEAEVVVEEDQTAKALLSLVTRSLHGV